MKILVFLALLLCLVESRSFPEYEDEEENSDDDSGPNVACQVQGTSLKICRECNPQYGGRCLPKPYSDCRCRDISFKSYGELVCSNAKLGSTKINLEIPVEYNGKTKYLQISSSVNNFSAVIPNHLPPFLYLVFQNKVIKLVLKISSRLENQQSKT